MLANEVLPDFGILLWNINLGFGIFGEFGLDLIARFRKKVLRNLGKSLTYSKSLPKVFGPILKISKF